MARYNLAASLLLPYLAGASRSLDELTDSWQALPVSIPTPLSDMSVAVLDGGDAGKRVVLTGGCDSPLGNQYMEFDGFEFFACTSISSKAYTFSPKVPNNTFQAWTGEFEELPDMPRERCRHASVVVGGKLCLFGGRDENDEIISEVDCYDPSADEWTTPATLPAEYTTSDLTAFARGTDVYVVAGYDKDYIAQVQVTIVDMSDMSDIKFGPGESLLEERGDIDAAVLPDGSVYVSGGFTHENYYEKPHNTVERYDPDTGKWSPVDSLNDERGDKQLVSLNGKVYAIGGEAKIDITGVAPEEIPDLGAISTVLDSVEVLDPEADVHGGLAQWRSLGGMPTALFRFGAAEWEGEVTGEEGGDGESADDGGYIFVFGGQVAYDADCECFRTTDQVMVFVSNCYFASPSFPWGHSPRFAEFPLTCFPLQFDHPARTAFGQDVKKAEFTREAKPTEPSAGVGVPVATALASCFLAVLALTT